jgi:hypothetical protein
MIALEKLIFNFKTVNNGGKVYSSRKQFFFQIHSLQLGAGLAQWYSAGVRAG